MEVRIDNILDMISSYGEEGVREDLDSFSSPQNQEVVGWFIWMQKTDQN